MAFSLIAAYHKLNHFLGRLEGDLFKKAVEFVLATIILYMLVSEYRKERSRELRYLIVGFSFLWLEKIITTLLLSQIVFVDPANAALVRYTPVITNLLEITALFIITTMLLGDVYKESVFAKARRGLAVCIAAFVLLQAVWLFRLFYFSSGTALILGLLVIFELAKIGILGYPIYCLFRRHALNKYLKKVCLAFAVYAVTPLIHLFNIILFAGANKYLKIIAHPFPFIAMLLFLRVIFIKLADKARIQEELALARRRYEASKKISRLKDEFVSTVNHELRTPLTSMKLYLSLLREGKMGPLRPEQKQAVDIVNKEAGRLAELINDILDVSKLESGRMALQPAQVQLSEILDSSPYKTLITEKKIRIRNKVPKHFPVTVDSARFKQVFVNLLSNAIKYSPEKGIITFAARRKKRSWEFSVHDSGPGISAEHQKKIFEKFYQIENHLTRSKGGTGLGLSITKKIVELHKGSIRLVSAPGKGSTFIVEVPLNL